MSLQNNDNEAITVFCKSEDLKIKALMLEDINVMAD